MSLFDRASQHARRSSSRRGRVLAGAATAIGLIALGPDWPSRYWVTIDSSNPAAASATSLSAPSVERGRGVSHLGEDQLDGRRPAHRNELRRGAQPRCEPSDRLHGPRVNVELHR